MADTAHGGTTEASRRPRRRRRGRALALVLVLAVTMAAGALLLRNPSPVGHWNSRAGYDEFIADYERAWAAMPEPDQTIDVRTGYGFVRAYRFDATTDTPAANPLVLLPGRSSPSPIWADNMPSLLALGDVYVVDLLGEPGLSVQEVLIESAADNAAWLDQTLAQLPEQEFILVGLSIGGWTAANLATRHPERVASLVLIDPVYTFDAIPLATALRAIPASVPWLPKSWRDNFASYTAGGAPVEDVPVARMTETAMRSYTIALPQPSLIPEEDLAALEMPVLAVLAGRSVMHDPQTSAEVAERVLRRGTVVMYPEASHAVGSEEAAGVAREIGEFLSREG